MDGQSAHPSVTPTPGSGQGSPGVGSTWGWGSAQEGAGALRSRFSSGSEWGPGSEVSPELELESGALPPPAAQFPQQPPPCVELPAGSLAQSLKPGLSASAGLQQPLCRMGSWGSSALLPHALQDQVTDNCPLLLAAPELGWALGSWPDCRGVGRVAGALPALSTQTPSDQQLQPPCSLAHTLTLTSPVGSPRVGGRLGPGPRS